MTQEKHTPPPYVSASQMAKIDVEAAPETSCERRYGFQYVMGFPDPAGAAAKLGGEVHEHLENFLEHGKPLPPGRAGRIAFTAIDYAKEALRHKPLEVERKFEHTEDGITYLGYVDVGWLHPAGMPVVRDWKTSSDPARYGLRTDTMMDNPQAVLYARQALTRFNTDRVMLDWVYMKTRGEMVPAFAVRAQFDHGTVDRSWRRVHELGKRATHIKQTTRHANDLAPNWKACGAYGKPCPFIDHCDGAKDPNRIISTISEQTGGFVKPTNILSIGLPAQATKTEPKEEKTMPSPAEILAAKRKRQGRKPPVDVRKNPPATAPAPAPEPAATPQAAPPQTVAEPGPVPVQGLDPNKVREAYDAQARAQRVNAPESGLDDVETQAAVSEATADVIEQHPGRGKNAEVRQAYAQAAAETVAQGGTAEQAAKAGEAAAEPKKPKKRKSTSKAGAVHATEAWLRCLTVASAANPTQTPDTILQIAETYYKAWTSNFA